MKQLKIPYIQSLNDVTELENAAIILDEKGTVDKIEILNWKEKFPYKPITYFIIARST